MRIKFAAAVAAIASMPFMAMTAQASTCVTAPVATYEVGGFSCTYNGLTFSDISVSTIGIVLLGNITPFTLGSEFGLSLNYAAVANSNSLLADVAWAYDVTGTQISDAYLALAGTTTGTGTATVGETLSNGVDLSLTAPGQVYAFFDPVGSLSVIKDQEDFAGTDGSSNTSILRNAFSLCTDCAPPPGTPLPGALPLFLSGGGLIGLIAARRKRKVAKAA